jgi:hypothetical protein
MVRCDLGSGERNWCASGVRPTAVRSRLPLQEAEEARMVFQLNWEAIMRFRTTGILSLSLGAMSLGASAAAQTTPAPPVITRTLIAATKLSTVTDVPLYFKAVSVTLPSDEKSSGSVANSIVYQILGSTEVSLDGETKMLNAGEGLFIVGAAEGHRASSTSSLSPLRTWIGLPNRHLRP